MSAEHLRARVHDVPHDRPRRRRSHGLLDRERDLQGLRLGDALARRQRVAADRRRASATCSDVPVRAHAPRRAHQPDLRGHQRDPALLHRALGHAGPGRGSSTTSSKAMREPIKGFGLLSDFAIRKARSALGRERLEPRPSAARARGRASSRSTRGTSRRASTRCCASHGKNIAEMQYTQKRVADMAIDLYAIASVHLAHDPRHREARRRRRAARDRSHDDLRRAPRRSASPRTSPPSTRTTTSSARRSRTSAVRRRRLPARHPLTSPRRR